MKIERMNGTRIKNVVIGKGKHHDNGTIIVTDKPAYVDVEQVYDEYTIGCWRTINVLWNTAVEAPSWHIRLWRRVFKSKIPQARLL